MKRGLSYKIALTAVFSALTYGATLLSIPIGMGYSNLGDAVIFVSCAFLGYLACVPAIIGSCLADLTLGYAIYIPATAVIKALMAVIVVFLSKRFVKDFFATNQQQQTTPLQSVRLFLVYLASSLFMQVGYTLYEVILLGFGATDYQNAAEIFAVTKLVLGGLQTVVCVPLAFCLTLVLKKYRVLQLS